MRLYETFYSSVGRNEDYSLTLGSADVPVFAIEFDGLTVTVEADFLLASTFVWDIVEPNIDAPYPARINGFRAVLRTDEIPEITQEISRRCRLVAFEVLQRVMIHLRDVTDDPLIDVHLSTFHVERYELSDDLERPIEEGSRDLEFFRSTHALTEDDWQQVIDRVRSNATVLPHRDLILAARSFLDTRNYNMAMLNAAMACEMLLHRLIVRKLVHANIIRYTAPEAMKNPERVNIVRKHELITDVQAQALSQIFRDRNGIVHWKFSGSITPEKADNAVQTAQQLETLLVAA